MLFYQRIIESYKMVQEALKVLLREQNPELTIHLNNDYPLLVLETSSDSAGFAIINDNPETNFASAYDAFKKLYRHNHSLWNNRNLSFIICRTDPSPISDAFFGTLETNVYFCRKYVICLHQDPDQLKRELLRLPFLPFPKSLAGELLRPPSAQTLLQNYNVSASLARQIVIPQECSAIRIVDQMLENKQELPLIQSGTELAVQHQEQPTEHMRIKNVEIEAFRAYKKKQTFDVDADIVVLYGPNGLGKTSFFDALDYVCTGRIGRLCQHRVNQKSFIDLARHLGSSKNDGLVSIQLRRGTTDTLVQRRVTRWGTALIDDEAHDRTKTLQYLTSAQLEPRKLRIENLERLFRATHLFSQTDQELLIEFVKDSTLSPDLVSRMLSLDDYASGLAKVREVLAQLNKLITQNDQQMNNLKEGLQKVKCRLAEMPQTQKAVEASSQIAKEATDVIKALQRLAGLGISETQPTVDSAREWRAIAESTLKDARDTLRQLQIAESNFSQFEKNSQALQSTMTEISSLEKLLAKQTKEHEQHQKTIYILTSSLEQEHIVSDQAKLRLRALEMFGGIQVIYQKANSSFQQWQRELERVSCEIEATTTEMQPLFLTTENLRAQIANHHEMVQSHTQIVQALSEVQDGITTWKENIKTIDSLQDAINKAQLYIQKANCTIDALRSGIAKKEQELTEYEEKYEQLSANQNELSRLLDEIEAHVENGNCPTCGTDHKSKGTLIKRIRSQKQVRPLNVEVLSKSCCKLRNTLKQDKATLTECVREQRSITSNLHENMKKLTDTSESITTFESIVSKIGLPIDEELSSTAACKAEEKRQALRRSGINLAELEAKLSENTMRLKALEQKQEELKALQGKVIATMKPLEKQITDLHTKADGLGLQLSMNSKELSAETKTAEYRESRADKHIAELTSQKEKIAQTVSVVKMKMKQVKEKLDILHRDKTLFESELRQYREDVATIIKHEAINLENIIEKIRLSAKRVDQLQLLYKRCSTLEITIDAMQHTAMRAELENQATLLLKNEQSLKEDIVNMYTNKEWFVIVKNLLDEQRSKVVANHVKELGPLTTLIQKRLRAVYGFGDVSLKAKGDEIIINVDWESNRVRPSDYFSDSQKQILMLSLFLSGRLTQTWSMFAPILLDDPVTHFDDLNAFGFVELIRGLVSSLPGKRQFFISTCEHRLFDLMLKKFGRLEGGAKFFKFESIGRDGPVITSVDL